MVRKSNRNRVVTMTVTLPGTDQDFFSRGVWRCGGVGVVLRDNCVCRGGGSVQGIMYNFGNFTMGI